MALHSLMWRVIREQVFQPWYWLGLNRFAGEEKNQEQKCQSATQKPTEDIDVSGSGSGGNDDDDGGEDDGGSASGDADDKSP